MRNIVSRLMEMGIKAPRGGDIWGIETIRKILNNEKYYGDVVLQKTYIADFFTGKQVPNRGECESYLLEYHPRRLFHERCVYRLKKCEKYGIMYAKCICHIDVTSLLLVFSLYV